PITRADYQRRTLGESEEPAWARRGTSPFGESDMRVPQLSERIKEAPAQALRGVFAGIGQLLLITDKLRNKPPASQQVPQARAPEASETVTPAASASAAADAAAPASAPAAASASEVLSAP